MNKEVIGDAGGTTMVDRGTKALGAKAVAEEARHVSRMDKESFILAETDGWQKISSCCRKRE